MPKPILKITKLEYGSIFTRDFSPLIQNNTITFAPSENIAVIYGPNGTGKTSLAKVLEGAKEAKIELEYDGQSYVSANGIFHVINDQNNRNIIKGTEKDFLLGDDIELEFKLQEYIDKEYNRILDLAISLLKNNHSISAVKSPLINVVHDLTLVELIKDLANRQSKGAKYTVETFLNIVSEIIKPELVEYDTAKLDFLKKDLDSTNSIIVTVETIKSSQLVANSKVTEIEENTEAIKILEHFHKEQCIVCDTPDIDPEELLKKKTNNRKSVIQSLDSDIRKMIEKVIPLTDDNDPFAIKSRLLEAIDKGDISIVNTLQNDFAQYKDILEKLIEADFAKLLDDSEIVEKYKAYQSLLEIKPEITDEDMKYIEDIIRGSMRKTLKIERDSRKNLRLFLENQDFIGKERNELPLSTGEQNFLSLTFEFLKAKNSNCPIVVLDDPISSFDSIYKNKIAYAIVKMLHGKQRIILTHNIDLLRLLEAQYPNCYTLFLLNNVEDEENGFIPLSKYEQKMLINLEKLIDTFRNDIFNYIQDIELFLIAMIPFMRGYSALIKNRDENDAKEKLTQLMHGYKVDIVNVAKIYTDLFGNSSDNKIPDEYMVSVSGILQKEVDIVGGVDIVDKKRYPLLNKTLKHSFTYLKLRLSVEKCLVEKYSINTSQYKQLGQIIDQAFPSDNNPDNIHNRIELTSKKTLINEFNHFEGNLSIFQPAIDITDCILRKEKSDIENFVNNL